MRQGGVKGGDEQLEYVASFEKTGYGMNPLAKEGGGGGGGG